MTFWQFNPYLAALFKQKGVAIIYRGIWMPENLGSKNAFLEKQMANQHLTMLYSESNSKEKKNALQARK